MAATAQERAPEAAVAPHRIGQPSPLIFHLGAALAGYQQALLGAPRADSPQFPWCEPFQAAAARLGPDLDQIEIAREIAARLSATLRGLELWQAHPYRRNVAEPPSIRTIGAARLVDYGQGPEATDPDGPPLLVVPSLINRAYILDLLPERSLLRWLAAQGLRPVLLDWGPPGAEEARFDLQDYGAERLLPAVEALVAETGRPVGLLGYCMGGTLAAGLAARTRGLVAALATIGAPWDFTSTRGIAGGIRAMVRAEGEAQAVSVLDGMAETFGTIPVSVFQMLFALINPMQAAVKFQRLSRLDPDGPAARHFVALEDWLADGVPMAPRAAKNLLIDWQIRNATATGAWHFLGGPVDPGAIRVPALGFCGTADSIAPMPLAAPLPRAIPGAAVVTPRTGHVGMVVGSVARTQVWRPLATFFHTHAG